MDPISAFGLAVNILTVIDLSVKVISTASEIRSCGESIATSDRAAIAQNFESRCDKLIESSKATSRSGDSNHATISTEDNAALQQLAEEAKAIARDIQQSLFRPQQGQARLKTIRDAFLSVWGEREMREKAGRLNEMRAEIQFGLIVSIKASVDAAASTGDQSLQKLDDATQRIITTLSSDTDILRSDLERRVADLNKVVLSHLDQDADLAGQRHDELLKAVARSGDPGTSAIPQDPALVTERILKRLWFPTINDRYEDILPAHKKTFEWIFSRDLPLDSSSTFIDWIDNGTGVYWISGRAGSGKSTLIKCMADDSRTQMLLETWAHGQPLVTAKYLFWDQSSDILQKSLDGLFRGILYEIIGKEPSFARLLFPDQFQEGNSWYISFPTSNELKRAFKRLVFLESSPVQVALLIDGLDEYSAPRGAQHELAETLKTAACSKHMKIIASSRPETVFEKAFASCEKFYLHEMTSRDRALFVSDKLYGHQRTSYLVKLSGGETEINDLIKSAVERSEGIFLWLRLVIEALIQELDVCESIGDLQSILIQFPRGLEKLFLHMMRRMLKENERRGFECLWIMHQSLGLRHKQSPYRKRRHWNYMFRLTVSCMDGAQMPFDAVLRTKFGRPSSAALDDTVTKVGNRLRSWCAGLLELKPCTQCFSGELDEPEVVFIHRSVSEFLKLPTTCSDLAVELAETSFDVNFMLMKGLLVKLKRESTGWGFSEDCHMWVIVELILRLAQFSTDDRRHETHALLSELDRSMTFYHEFLDNIPSFRRTCERHFGATHWTNFFPWYMRYDRVKNSKMSLSLRHCSCIERSPDFLSIAVESGLAEFVLDTLNNPEMKASMNATLSVALLNSACRPPPFSIVVPGIIRPAIIHRLLDLGANPNQVCKDGLGRKTTPWKSMLKTVNDLEIMTVEGARQFAEILTAMIKHGADPHVRIRTKTFVNRCDTEYVGDVPNDPSTSAEAIVLSTDDFTASRNTGQDEGRPYLESHYRGSELPELQVAASLYSEEEPLYASGSFKDGPPLPLGNSRLYPGCWKASSLTVRGIIDQAFITRPSSRKENYDSELPGKFVPFEEIDSTWEIEDDEWGHQCGATYPRTTHPPKLTSLEKESIQKMGLALLKLLDQKKSFGMLIRKLFRAHR